ncbi:MAG TPA: DNA primase [Candidatus Choladousia intestinavium]|uniref:DNA primase n=1 Tax=Candidatus Choladousia intestinavium TaxID=2840727 RepID=A0A9D1A9F0_9FIRM|nr:DNA primase [Candidatus Choladousia intestinavium]
MYYPDEIIEEVRTRNDIVDLISGYVKLQRRGSSYFGLCPFHNEKSPSFSVSPGKQMYYCFGCGAGGNVFTFLMEYENYSFPEAVKALADRAGVALPEMEYSQEARRARDEKNAVLEVNREAAKYYYYLLRTPEGAPGMEYLKKRGLTAETMQRFGLGYAGRYSDGLYRYLKKKGISDELLKKSGLMQVNEKQGMYDKFWNRVMFPIMDINGKVVGFGGRVMGDGKPKYLNSPETVIFDKSRNLYGLNFARSSRKKQLLVCEGYMDVISLHQAGFTNAVASLGTALTSQHASLLKRYTDEAVLTYDSDEAGIRAALRAVPLLKQAGVTARVLHMAPYKDPDEFIKALGAEAFQERIDQAENSFMFEVSVLEKSFDMGDPEEKTKFFQAVARRISEFELELERENYIEAIAGKYQISFQGLRKMVMNWLMQGVPRRKEPVKPGNRREKEDGIRKSQRLILTWLAEHPGIYPAVSQYIRPEDFSDELYQKAAELLFEQLEKGEVNPARILNAFDNPEEQRQAAALFNTDISVETPQEWNKAVRETLAKIMDYSIKKKTAQMDPADLQGLQKLIDAKRRLQDLGHLHISL